MVDRYSLGAIYVFSSITYLMTMLSLVGSICITKPSVEQFPTTHLVYETDNVPKKKFYKPIYVDTTIETHKDNTATSKTHFTIDTYPN